MSEKSFGVFGLGKFGRSVAENLSAFGCEVLVVDLNEEKIHDIADNVTYAVKGDVTDQDVLQSIGIRNLDMVIVAISNDLEASIMATILAKELGVPKVMAKASNEMHEKILQKIGADIIIFPEREMGARVARNVISGNFIDLIDLSDTFSIVEMRVPETWAGKTLRELCVRDRYGVNVIALKEKGKLDVTMEPDTPLKRGASIIVVGENSNLSVLQ